MPVPDGAPAGLPDSAVEAVALEGRATPEGAGRAPASREIWLFRPGQEPAPAGVTELPALVGDDANFVWIDLTEYAAEDLHELAALLQLHPSAVRGTLASWHRPRLAIYPTHFYVSATVVRPDPVAYRVEVGQLDVYVGNNFLVSVHKQPLPFGEHLHERAYHSPELVALDAGYMLYLVLDETLAYYEEVNRSLQNTIQRLEERALRDPSDSFLEDLLRVKRYVFALAQLAEQHRDVFVALLRPDFPWIAATPVEEYFRDLESRLARLVDLLASAQNAVNGAFDIYVSHMAHRTNQVIKLLTMVSTVLLPSTLVLGLFGTNIATSIRSVPAGTPLGFIVMVVTMVVVSLGVLAAFRRRDWL
jgi:magnesium transporter